MPPPPPPPPPPPTSVPISQPPKLRRNDAKDRNALLNDITKFKGAKLKKTQTNDRSGPIMTAPKNSGGGGGAGIGGGLFSGGMPQLRKASGQPGEAMFPPRQGNHRNGARTGYPHGPSGFSSHSSHTDHTIDYRGDSSNNNFHSSNSAPPPPVLSTSRKPATFGYSSGRQFGNQRSSIVPPPPPSSRNSGPPPPPPSRNSGPPSFSLPRNNSPPPPPSSRHGAPPPPHSPRNRGPPPPLLRDNGHPSPPSGRNHDFSNRGPPHLLPPRNDSSPFHSNGPPPSPSYGGPILKSSDPHLPFSSRVKPTPLSSRSNVPPPSSSVAPSYSTSHGSRGEHLPTFGSNPHFHDRDPPPPPSRNVSSSMASHGTMSFNNQGFPNDTLRQRSSSQGFGPPPTSTIPRNYQGRNGPPPPPPARGGGPSSDGTLGRGKPPPPPQRYDVGGPPPPPARNSSGFQNQAPAMNRFSNTFNDDDFDGRFHFRKDLPPPETFRAYPKTYPSQNSRRDERVQYHQPPNAIPPHFPPSLRA